MKYLSLFLVLSTSMTPHLYCKVKAVFTPTPDSIHAVTLLPAPLYEQTNQVQKLLSLSSYITQLQTNSQQLYCSLFDPAAPMLVVDAWYGIHTKDIPVITLFSRGYAKKDKPQNEMPRVGGGVYSAHHYIRAGAITTPCVTFDYPDGREYFNFGNMIDYSCLRFAYETIHEESPNSKIILMGDCRGALVALSLAADDPHNIIDTLVLASPITTASRLIEQISINYLWLLGSFGPKLLNTIFNWYFPNYNPDDSAIAEKISLIKNKTIFIAHRIGDTLISEEGVTDLVTILRKNNTVYCIMIDDQSAPHSKLYMTHDFNRALNAFYKKYSLPYHAQLALEGESILEKGFVASYTNYAPEN